MDATEVLPEPDQLHASAVKFLIEDNDGEAASVLLACRIERVYEATSGYNGSQSLMCVNLRGPAPAYNLLKNWYNTDTNSIARRVCAAFEALRPHGWALGGMTIRAELVELDKEWLAELAELARGKSVDNQASDRNAPHTYSGLRFRSVSEIRIAEALDRAGVMYFPLCKGRMNSGRNRVNREPDFLICHRGKWGILEVDGEPYHPPSRTVEDHTRDRLFKGHGIVVVEHFDAKHCYDIPDEVVKRFLALLENARPG